jgi:hypothetical protein
MCSDVLKEQKAFFFFFFLILALARIRHSQAANKKKTGAFAAAEVAGGDVRCG